MQLCAAKTIRESQSLQRREMLCSTVSEYMLHLHPSEAIKGVCQPQY